MRQMISLLGLLVMIALAWSLSENRRRMNLRLIISGVALQFALAVLLLATPLRDRVFDFVDRLMSGLIACSDAGAQFVFGDGFREHYFAFSVMPTVIFFSSLTAVLFYLGVLQWVVKAMARLMVWVMDVSGSESLCAAANVFVGMTTAPLVIKPYLQTMTRSELMAMMTGGMATVAGGTMVAYVQMGANAGHLMVASLISAPASLVIAKIMAPETEESVTKGRVKIEVPKTDANVLDAACRGAGEGLKLVLNIVAMLIAFIALVHLVNWILLGLTGSVNQVAAWIAPNDATPWTLQALLGGKDLTLEMILGWLCAPLAWIMGVEWNDAPTVGMLLGEKTIFNEFVAYQHFLTEEVYGGLGERSRVITTYALCGFANFGSIAVMIGGVSGLAPDRRKDFARYGFRSMIGGALAAFMTAAIAGMLIPKAPPEAKRPKPLIEFTDVPAYGETEQLLKGRVENVTPDDYNVAVYVNVEGWWSKPQMADRLTRIEPDHETVEPDDGTWTCDIATGRRDGQATEIAAFLVPKGYQPPLMLGGAKLPPELDKNALAKVQIARRPANE